MKASEAETKSSQGESNTKASQISSQNDGEGNKSP